MKVLVLKMKDKTFVLVKVTGIDINVETSVLICRTEIVNAEAQT